MNDDTKIRDELARDRTVMANERTLLAYGRTALGLLALAVFIFKFTPPIFALAAGSVALGAALFVFFWGIRNYRIADLHLRALIKLEAKHHSSVEAD
jgi:putative membrane protein